MNTGREYLRKTESAVQTLFKGIDTYVALLRGHSDAVFVTSYTNYADLQLQFDAWAEKNQEALARQRAAVTRYSDEVFAQAALCGSVLQIAAKGLSIYSDNATVPKEWKSVVSKSMARYCIGRSLRGVPLGLVIYAARNQHTHYEDDELREPGPAVFESLAVNHGYSSAERDPSFDLNNKAIDSFANNVTGLMGWRSYEAYLADMELLIG